MSNIINGREIATKILANLKKKISEIDLQNQITLAVILVGDDEASQKYVKRKQIASAEVGINCEVFKFSRKYYCH